MGTMLGTVFIEEMNPLTVEATLKGESVRPLVKTLYFTIRE